MDPLKFLCFSLQNLKRNKTLQTYLYFRQRLNSELITRNWVYSEFPRTPNWRKWADWRVTKWYNKMLRSMFRWKAFRYHALMSTKLFMKTSPFPRKFHLHSMQFLSICFSFSTSILHVCKISFFDAEQESILTCFQFLTIFTGLKTEQTLRKESCSAVIWNR